MQWNDSALNPTLNLNAQLEELQHRPVPSTQTADQPEMVRFSSQICDGSVRHWQLRPGLDLTIHDAAFWKRAVVGRGSTESKPQLGMSFCMAGQIRGLGSVSSQKIQLQAGQASLGVMNGAGGSIEYAAGQRVLIVHMHVQPDAISLGAEGTLEQLPTSLQEAIPGGDRPSYFEASPMTAVMNATVQQLLNCPYQGLIQRLYLESKTIELIGLYFDQILVNTSLERGASDLKPDEVDRIFHARDILLGRIANPPTLLELSHQVGLNDRKLKQGFRHVFGMTVFGYLRHYRMQQARQLLLIPGATIASVAQVVGYSNPEAFSVAFRRAFAMNPKAYQLQQR